MIQGAVWGWLFTLKDEWTRQGEMRGCQIKRSGGYERASVIRQGVER